MNTEMNTEMKFVNKDLTELVEGDVLLGGWVVTKIKSLSSHRGRLTVTHPDGRRLTNDHLIYTTFSVVAAEQGNC